MLRSDSQSRQIVLLNSASWRARESAHQARADTLTSAHLARRATRERHPVEDFLWTYYSVKPAELRRWHPGAGIVLEGTDTGRSTWRYYTPHARGISIDLTAFFAKRGGTVDYVEQLLSATLDHTPQFGCFGLHEWAMIYRMSPEQLRHVGLPLRIGHEASDHVVETNPISCSHFDAYRFFTPEAAPFNALRPSRDTQPMLEQSGCLHAGMDVYKWAAKLGPIVPGEVLLDAFVLARDIREVDMRASPYDVSGYLGADGTALHAVPIETPEGKRQYAQLQRGFAARADTLRHRVLEAITLAKTLR